MLILQILMIFYVNLAYNVIATPTSTGSAYFSTEETGFLSPDSTQYVPAMESTSALESKSFTLGLSLGADGRTTGPAPPQDVSIRILHEVAGANRVAALDPETNNFLGQAASLYGVGVGGDGTAYTSGSPLTVASGKVVKHKRVGKLYDELTIRPHSDAFRVTVPRGRLVGYPDGLRFDGNSAEAEIIGYDSVPTTFTLGAQVLFQRAWDVGASDTQTIAGTRSARLYFTKTTNEYGRQLHFDYEKSGPTTVTIDGPTFDADESIKAITARVNTNYTGGIGTGVEVEFGIDGEFTTVSDGVQTFSATAENWKLGRFRTSTTDTADTIIGGWFLFDTLLDDKTLISYNTRRLTGDEDNLVWYFPGVAVAGSLLDLAAANASSPLDATITTATSAPLFLGTPDLAGVVLPEVIGYVKNAPLTAIDPARKIYRAAFDPVSAIVTVQDRQVPYTIEAVYESPLDFADNPPTASGNVTVTPWMGGLVRVHTEVDGVENTADVIGHDIFQNGLVLGLDYSSASAIWGTTDLDSIFNNPPWSHELRFNFSGTTGNHYMWFSDYWTLRGIFSTNYGGAIFTAVVNTTGSNIAMTFTVETEETNWLRLEAYESGGDVFCRILLNGSVVTTGSESGVTLYSGTSLQAPTLVYDLSFQMFDRASVLPMRLWSEVGSSDADAEAKQRLYLYQDPSPSATNLEGLWSYYTTSRTTLVDQTANANHATVGSGAVWSPGIGATDRLSAAHYLLNKSSTSVTFDDTAYDYDPSAISYPIAGGPTTPDSSQPVGITVAQAAASALSGGGLYLLLDADGTATIGQAQDPATATPTATERVEFLDLDSAEYEFQPSVIEALYAPNPVVQSSVLAGADSDRRSFAERPYRSLDEEVGDNRTLYGDDPVPDGRRWLVDTKFADREPARGEAVRLAAQWDSPRPFRPFYIQGRDSSRTDAGYTSYGPGDVLTIQNDRLPGGEVTILVLDVKKGSAADVFTGR